LEASKGNQIGFIHMTTKVLRCDAETVAAVAEWGREHGGLNVSDAATILLAAALGRSKATELNRAERDTAHGQGANGHAEEDGPPAPVPPDGRNRCDEPAPIALDAATEALIADAVERASWGLWPIETELLGACPGFVLQDPPTVRARFMALIKEAEAHGFERQTSPCTSYLLDRLQGRPGPAAMYAPSRPAG
jgi:hypothetical protein